jgi:hypothetical protein
MKVMTMRIIKSPRVGEEVDKENQQSKKADLLEFKAVMMVMPTRMTWMNSAHTR